MIGLPVVDKAETKDVFDILKSVGELDDVSSSECCESVYCFRAAIGQDAPTWAKSERRLFSEDVTALLAAAHVMAVARVAELQNRQLIYSLPRDDAVERSDSTEPELEHPPAGYAPPAESLESLEACTVLRERSEDLYTTIRALFAEGKEESFEDGMESEFSGRLLSLLEEHGNAAMEPLAHLIVYQKVNPEVAAEALRWVGRVEDPGSYQYRRWLLEQALNCASPAVRDGACLGLASMDDPHARVYLKRAITREGCPELREDMEQVLDQLGE